MELDNKYLLLRGKSDDILHVLNGTISLARSKEIQKDISENERRTHHSLEKKRNTRKKERPIFCREFLDDVI